MLAYDRKKLEVSRIRVFSCFGHSGVLASARVTALRIRANPFIKPMVLQLRAGAGRAAEFRARSPKIKLPSKPVCSATPFLKVQDPYEIIAKRTL